MQMQIWLALGALIVLSPVVAATPEPYVCEGSEVGVGVRNVNDSGFDTGCIPGASPVVLCDSGTDTGVMLYAGTHPVAINGHTCTNSSAVQSDVEEIRSGVEACAMSPMDCLP